mmetsp:Transcript_73056/g.164061  ORF Transcript_73056/g.164061 Transcript_73056/m.164061 type:complete len:294 (-) Transcript_73056:274-1155(-)
MNAHVGVHQVAQLPYLQQESGIVKGLAILAGLHPTQVAHQVPCLEATLALRQLLASRCEGLLLGVALAFLEDGAQEPLGLATCALHLLVSDLIHCALALPVLEEDVPQPHLRGVLLPGPLQRRSLWVLNTVEEHHDGPQAEVTDLSEPLHRGIDKSAGGHAGSACTPPEDGGYGCAAADGVVEGAADECETVMLVLQVQDLHIRGGQQSRHAPGSLEADVAEGARPPDGRRRAGLGGSCGSLVLVVLIVIIVVWVGHGMRLDKLLGLTATQAHHTSDVSEAGDDQAPTGDQCY